MINNKFFKRYSSYANLVMLVASTVLAVLPQVTLPAEALLALTITGNVVIGLCQLVKQKGAA